MLNYNQCHICHTRLRTEHTGMGWYCPESPQLEVIWVGEEQLFFCHQDCKEIYLNIEHPPTIPIKNVL